MNGLAEAKAAVEELRRFIGCNQIAALNILFMGEDRQFFFDRESPEPRIGHAENLRAGCEG